MAMYVGERFVNEFVASVWSAVVQRPVAHVACGYVLLSTAYASTAVARARMSLIVRFCLPRWTALSRFGMAIAARMPMIAMTISSSIRVKPDSRFFMTLYSPSAIEIPLLM